MAHGSAVGWFRYQSVPRVICFLWYLVQYISILFLLFVSGYSTHHNNGTYRCTLVQ